MSHAPRVALLLGLAAACSSNPTGPDPTLPDLVISSAILTTDSASLASQGPIGYCFEMRNAGATRTVESQFDIAGYLSTDRTFSPDDHQWIQFYRAANYTLTAGFTTQRCDSLPLGNPKPAAGTYYLIVVADAFPGLPPNNYPGVIEANEANNWRASSTTVTIVQ